MCESSMWSCNHVDRDNFVQRCKKAQSSGFACRALTKVTRKAPCSKCWLAEFDKKMARKHIELDCKTLARASKDSGGAHIKEGMQSTQAKTLKTLPAIGYKGGLEYDREKGYCVNKEGNRVLIPKMLIDPPSQNDLAFKSVAFEFSKPVTVGEQLSSIDEAVARIDELY